MSERNSPEYLRELAPFGQMPVLRAVRLKCGECMGGVPGETPRGEVAEAIAECGSATCALWPFRLNSNPWRAEPSEAQREAARRNVANVRMASV